MAMREQRVGFGVGPAPVFWIGIAFCSGLVGCGQPTGNPPVDADTYEYQPVIESPVPTRIALEDVVDVAAGYQHHCAVTGEGDVFCWGSNHEGQLGDGTTTDSASPVQVVGLPAATRVVVGMSQPESCAVVADGSVWCWGKNIYGAVGSGTIGMFEDPVPPSQQPEVTDASAVAVGFGHSCALLRSGTVECWGADGVGQRGDGAEDLDLGNSPSDVVGLTNALWLTSSMNLVCALTTSGELWCWGQG